VLFGAACIALGETGTAAEAVALPAQALPAARRCPYCGSIESKRKLPPLSGDPHALLSYEYTVRFGDGSSRVFQEELPASWRLGERLIFIDGLHK
jgi:hypothetical protein